MEAQTTRKRGPVPVFDMSLLGIACVALIGALALASPRWPAVAWGSVVMMIAGGLLWPVAVYFGADLQSGPFSAAAWPPGAVSTVAAWAGMLVSDVLGFIALVLVLFLHPVSRKVGGAK